MVFAGVTAQAPDNADLFVAVSSDGGAHFSGSPAGKQVLHLTDADLGDPPNSQQFMAAVTVDGGGGVNIFYYTATLHSVPPDSHYAWWYQAKYAHLPSFQYADTTPPVTNIALGDVFALDDSGAGLALAGTTYHMGDYIMADSRGCEVYGGFVSRHLGSQVHTFVSKINTCPIAADVNTDGQVNVADAQLFTQCYILGDNRADLSHDGVINAIDAALFNQSYSCGCTPP